jgi:hypothetical protein
LETVIMNLRLAALAAMCREAIIPASVLIAAYGSTGIDRIVAEPIVTHAAPALAVVADAAQPLPPTAADQAAPGQVVALTVTADPAAPQPEPIVVAALTDPSELPPPAVSPEAVAPSEPAASPEPVASSAHPEPIVMAALTDSSEMPAAAPPQPAAVSPLALEPSAAEPAVDSTEFLGECLVVDRCVDQYLWMLYQRAPKEDALKTREQRKVTVKKRGRLVTVTRTFTRIADQDFSWKDPDAAEKAGLAMLDYVIGGMDREFKLKLFHLLHAAEQAGLRPGITSAFRDDYRQSIASGLKAANDRSYHGGSLRGGYGHGLAADVVSVNGATRAQRVASTQIFWRWIDAHGAEFGVARPYLGRDPPHVAPIDGKEYADHRAAPKARAAGSAAKQRLASPADRNSARAAKTAKSSRMKTVGPA